MDCDTAKKIASQIVRWYEVNKRDLPWRREPYCSDPYCVMVSEIMLQQTQVKTVIPYFERWMRLFPRVEDLARADEERVLKAWEGLGYYRRARNLHRAARMMQKVPSTHEEWMKLPGVGRYTAGAICSIAFDQPTPIVDGNVARVLARLALLEGEAAFWPMAQELVEAASSPSSLNQGLMELGATICTPRAPNCPACPVNGECRAYLSGRVAEFPRPTKRPAIRRRRFAAVILRRGASVLVRRREDGKVNGSLWEFPNFELSWRPGVREQLTGFLGEDVPVEKFSTVRHTITNNRITLVAYRADSAPSALASRLDARWIALSKLEALPFSAAHARLRNLLKGKDGSATLAV